MYTFESKFFSEEFKTKALEAIEEARSFLTPEDFLKETSCQSEAESVASWGHRWKRNDDCYQSMIMFLSRHMRDVRGPGFMTEEEAHSLEASMCRSGLDGLTFKQAAREGVLGAISCDHWYLFEKQWD
jgi:hypothetical protein